jgi:hypothetical protein
MCEDISIDDFVGLLASYKMANFIEEFEFLHQRSERQNGATKHILRQSGQSTTWNPLDVPQFVPLVEPEYNQTTINFKCNLL